jgi:hypothetical protein
MKSSNKQFWSSPLFYLFLLLLLLSDTRITSAQSRGTFVSAGNMTTARISHTATLLPNGKVLIAGGSEPVPGQRWNTLASAELFDPDTGTFTATGNMTTRRSGHAATLLADGRVLIVGGDADGDANSGTAELYDPSTATFTPTGNMDVRVVSAATLLDNGKVLITGAHPLLYDPSTGTFASAGEYAQADIKNPYGPSGGWYAPTLSLPNGKVLIAGEPSTELYDPVTGTFTLAGTMATRPWGAIPWYIEGRTGTLLTNGQVLLAGGEHEDLGYFAEAELYDPATGTFTAIGNMTRNRDDHTATLLRDGTVLLAGAQYGGVVASTELYDPATDTFSRSADMIFGRFFHTATLLMDGRVLIAGGYTGWPATPNSFTAELYVPSVLVPAPVIESFLFDRSSVVAGSSYSVDVSGSNLTPQTFFDVRFTGPGSNESAVILNWQRGLDVSHDVPAWIASGTWTINGVRPHEIETDHTGSFFPVSATITVLP